MVVGNATNIDTAVRGWNTTSRELARVVLIGTYPPRQCGIATFTADVYNALSSALPKVDLCVLPLTGGPDTGPYPPEVRFLIGPSSESFRNAADYVLTHEFDVLFLQHEFGLFPGEAGEGLFELLDRVQVPVVTMLHTVLREPTPAQERVMRKLIDKSVGLITMTRTGHQLLLNTYNAPADKLVVIPHGIPETPPPDPAGMKPKLGLAGRQVGLTFGLLSPGKGIEHAIDALPAVVERHPDYLYVVLGATHPNLVRQEGERYRDGLMSRAERLGVSDHVAFINRFIELDELTTYLRAADIYITPYVNEAQSTSGTLAYAYGCGVPIVSTRYWHAAELLEGGRGRLVPFADAKAIAQSISELLGDEAERKRISRSAYRAGRKMVWSVVGRDMATVIRHARSTSLGAARLRQGPNRPPAVLVNLQHLEGLTDDVGLIQHATYHIPNRREGYCTDDNCRALMLTVLLSHLGRSDETVSKLRRRYAAFLDYAVDGDGGTVRNFMGYDRRWIESAGSDDSHGRVAWTLGFCTNRAVEFGLRCRSAQLIGPVLARCAACTSLRSWAFAALGAAEYQERFRGERTSQSALQVLGEKLRREYRIYAGPEWPWYEDVLAYDNARIPQAAIRIGTVLGDESLIEIGLTSLAWLCEIQTAAEGHFRPIGNRCFYRRGKRRAIYDQQPVEAWATVSAALTALAATNDPAWTAIAKKAFEWFLGRNDLGVPIIDANTGACCDGLQFDRVNRNQGAESTLAWLMAAAEWELAGLTAPPGYLTDFRAARGLIVGPHSRSTPHQAGQFLLSPES